MNVENDCPVCGGYGYTVEPECCRRAEWECGSRGCSGPMPVQVCCEECNGQGTITLEDEHKTI